MGTRRGVRAHAVTGHGSALARLPIKRIVVFPVGYATVDRRSTGASSAGDSGSRSAFAGTTSAAASAFPVFPSRAHLPARPLTFPLSAYGGVFFSTFLALVFVFETPWPTKPMCNRAYCWSGFERGLTAPTAPTRWGAPASLCSRASSPPCRLLARKGGSVCPLPALTHTPAPGLSGSASGLGRRANLRGGSALQARCRVWWCRVWDPPRGEASLL